MKRDMSLPEPMSSEDCDLRGMEWMPLNTANLLDSTLFLESTGDEFKAAMALICASWRQVPAGSLPASDKSLATLARTDNWTAVRTMAMRNWVLCSDGRYYHAIVAAKAMEALPHRQEFVEKKTAEANRKERERKDRKDLFATLREAGIVLPYDTKTSELRARVRDLGQAPVTPRVTGQPVTPVTDVNRDLSRLGQGHHLTPQTPDKGSEDIPPKPPRKRRGAAAAQQLVTVEQMVAEGVQEQHAQDWLTVRRKKDSPLTPTAWEAVKAQAVLAGLSLDDAVRTSAEQNWAGFKAKWIGAGGQALPAAGNRQEQLEDRNRNVGGDDWVQGGAS